LFFASQNSLKENPAKLQPQRHIAMALIDRVVGIIAFGTICRITFEPRKLKENSYGRERDPRSNRHNSVITGTEQSASNKSRLPSFPAGKPTEANGKNAARYQFLTLAPPSFHRCVVSLWPYLSHVDDCDRTMSNV
jgi:hypothetical protein